MMKKSQIAWDVVITSMLTTMGSCCVVGKNEDHVNQAIFYTYTMHVDVICLQPSKN